MRPLLFAGDRSFTRAELVADGPPVFVAEPTVETVARVLTHLARRRPFVPLHPRWTGAEVARAAAQVAAAPPLPDGTLAVLFTSGTTGRPRGVILGRAAFIAAARGSGARLGWRADDRWLLTLPLAHVGGLAVVVRCLLGRRPIVLGRPDTVAEDLRRHRATLVSLVPAQLARLLDAGFTPPAHLRAVLLGGAAASPALLARAARAGVPVVATYGLTEACSQVATQIPGTPEAGGAGVGPPLPGTRVRAVAGRLELDGPTLFDGYLGEPRRPPGWFATGDLGALDERGHLHVHGRADDLIVTGGENVAPAEIEAHLEQHGVRACVFGVPDATWGEVVAALVCRGELGGDALAGLAPFKRPRLVARAAELPETATGKIDRCAARRLAARVGLRPR